MACEPWENRTLQRERNLGVSGTPAGTQKAIPSAEPGRQADEGPLLEADKRGSDG